MAVVTVVVAVSMVDVVAYVSVFDAVDEITLEVLIMIDGVGESTDVVVATGTDDGVALVVVAGVVVLFAVNGNRSVTKLKNM